MSEEPPKLCRICLEDGSKEGLFRPCLCSGTQGLVHQACLSTWLLSSGRTTCEICQTAFVSRRMRQPPTRWKCPHHGVRYTAFFIVTILSAIGVAYALFLTVSNKDNSFSSAMALGGAAFGLIYVLGCLAYICPRVFYCCRTYTRQASVYVIQPYDGPGDQENPEESTSMHQEDWV